MARDKYAYDFSLFGSIDSDSAAPQLEPKREGELLPFKSPSKKNEKKSPNKKTKKSTKKKSQSLLSAFADAVVSPSMLVFKVLAAVTVVFAFVSVAMCLNVKLDETAKEINRIESEIKIAESENIRLKSNLEGAVSIDKLEQYAVKNLGMVKLEDYKVTYLDSQEDDCVVISGGKSYDDGIGSKLAALKEYIFD